MSHAESTVMNTGASSDPHARWRVSAGTYYAEQEYGVVPRGAMRAVGKARRGGIAELFCTSRNAARRDAAPIECNHT